MPKIRKFVGVVKAGQMLHTDRQTDRGYLIGPSALRGPKWRRNAQRLRPRYAAKIDLLVRGKKDELAKRLFEYFNKDSSSSAESSPTRSPDDNSDQRRSRSSSRSISRSPVRSPAQSELGEGELRDSEGHCTADDEEMNVLL